MAPERPEPVCAEIGALIEAYVDGDLGSKSADRVHTHLDECEHCREQWQCAIDIKKDLHGLPQPSCPDAVMDRVLHEIGAAKPEPARRRFAFAMPLGLAAAAAVAIGVSLWLSAPNAPQAPPHETAAAPYSEDELARAEAQVKWTLAYIGRKNVESAESVEGHLAALPIIEPARKVLNILLNRGDAAAPSQEI